MKIRLKKAELIEGDFDVVEALRARAAQHVERHLNASTVETPMMSAPMTNPVMMRKIAEVERREPPYDLWGAKLCLEIAALFESTEPLKRGRVAR